ncbi:MAG: threonine/serine dehydratase [Nitrospinota bacterium]
MKPPTFEDVLRARRVVYRFLAPTPFHEVLPLSERLGCRYYLKFESMQPTGAFKVRGGVNLLSRLSPEERRRGVITASTGNHGQSVAFAARAAGVRAIVAAPEGANRDKVSAMRALGAEVVFRGRDFDEARGWVEEEAERQGYRYIHSANEPLLIAGVATEALEIFEALPEADVLLVPVGGGSGVSGCGIVARALKPGVRIIGVQAERAPAVYRSFRAGRAMEEPSAATFAEGLATRVPFELTFSLIRQLVDEMVLVSEAEMVSAIRLLAETAHVVAEGAGAAATAAAFKLKDSLRGRHVVGLLTGRNLPLAHLRLILDGGVPEP